MNNLSKHFWFKLFLCCFIGFFFLKWIFNNIDISEVKTLSYRVNYKVILGAFLSYSLAIIFRAIRWQKLILNSVFLSFPKVYRALIVGYAMNIILPARLGEFFRINICKKWYALPRSTILATIVWERISDILIIITCLLIGGLSISVSNDTLEIKRLMFLGLCIFFTGVSFIIFLRMIPLSHFLKKWPLLLNRAKIFQKGIQVLTILALFQMIGWGLIIWAFEGFSLWLIVKATGITFNIIEICLLIGVVSLSTLLPTFPGFLGTMQFAFAIVLMAKGYSASFGILAATLNQFFILGGITLLGILILAWTSFREKKFNLGKI